MSIAENCLFHLDQDKRYQKYVSYLHRKAVYIGGHLFILKLSFFYFLFSFLIQFYFCLTYSGCVDTKGRSNSDHLLPLDHERQLQQHGCCVFSLNYVASVSTSQLKSSHKQSVNKWPWLQINLIYRTRQKTCLYVDRMQQCTKEKKISQFTFMIFHIIMHECKKRK